MFHFVWCHFDSFRTRAAQRLVLLAGGESQTPRGDKITSQDNACGRGQYHPSSAYFVGQTICKNEWRSWKIASDGVEPSTLTARLCNSVELSNAISFITHSCRKSAQRFALPAGDLRGTRIERILYHLPNLLGLPRRKPVRCTLC